MTNIRTDESLEALAKSARTLDQQPIAFPAADVAEFCEEIVYLRKRFRSTAVRNKHLHDAIRGLERAVRRLKAEGVKRA